MFSESSGWSRRCIVIFFTIATYCLFLLESEQRPKLPHLFITCQFPSYLLSSYLFFPRCCGKASDTNLLLPPSPHVSYWETKIIQYNPSIPTDIILLHKTQKSSRLIGHSLSYDFVLRKVSVDQ